MRRVLRLLARLFAGLIVGLLLLVTLLVALSGWLVASDGGNRWLFGQLQDHLPGFALERSEGNLVHGLSLYGLRYQAPMLDLSLEDVGLRFDWDCLAKQTVCIERLGAARGFVAFTPVDMQEEVETEEPEGAPLTIILPFGVELRQLQLTQVSYRMPGVDVSLDSFLAAANMRGDTLTLQPTELAGLQLSLSEGDDATPPPAPAGAQPATSTTAAGSLPSSPAATPSAQPALPVVQLPLAIVVEQLTLTDSQLDLYGTKERLEAVTLKAQWRGSLLTIGQLAVRHAMADAALSGQIDLQGDYPLDLSLEGRLKQLESLSGQQLEASADGDLARLTVAVKASQPVNANLIGELRPLAANLPFELALDWSELGWPLTGAPDYLVRDGQLSASGSLKDYRFTLKTALSGTGLPAARLDASGRGDLQQLGKLALALDTLGGKATLDGRLGWQQGLDWKARLMLANIDPGQHWPAAKGLINGKLETHGKLQQGWQASVDTLDIKGELAGYPLQLQGSLASSQANLLSTKGLLIRSGDNRIRIEGALADQWDLLARVELDDLHQSVPAAAGRINGEVRFSGPRQAPKMNSQLHIQEFAWGQDIALAAARLKGSVALTEDFSPSGQLRLDFSDLHAPGSQIRRGELTLQGSLAEHQLALRAFGEPVSSRLNIAGGLADNHWRGALASARLETPVSDWVLEEPVKLDVDLQTAVFQVALHCWRSNPTRLCLEKATPLGRQGEITLALSQFDVAKITDFLPEDLIWQGSFDAGVNLAWGAAKPPYLSAHIESTPGSLQWAGAPAEETLRYQQIRLRALLDETEAQGEVLLRSEQLGELTVEAAIDPKDPQRRLNGTFRLAKLQLDRLQPFSGPVERLAGRLEGNGEINGTLEQPLLSGRIALSDGAVGGDELPMELSDIGLEVAFSGQQAQLSGSLRAGKGKASLQGEADWRRMPVSANVTLKGERLEVDHPYAKLQVSPDMRIRLADQQLSIDGRVDVPWGRVEVRELPPDAVSISDDVVIVEQQQQEAARPLPISMALQIKLGDDITLDALGLKGKVSGQLKLEQEPRQLLQGVGELFITEGNFKAYGQDLLIDDGRIVFSGPLGNPYLNVRAYRNPEVTEDNVIAGVLLQGNVDAPKLTIYSEPAMNQQQQLSYLLRGRALDAQGSGNINAMLLGIGVGRVGGVVSKFGEAVGVKDLTVDTRGAGDDTQVELKAYLLPGVQVSYGVGVFDAANELTIRYQVLPKVYLQATSGLKSAIDLFYEFEFD